MNNAHAEWSSWSPRPEIAPTFADAGDGILDIATTGNAGIYGAWKRRYSPITPNRHYRLVARYRTHDMSDAAFHVTARLEWLDSSGQRIRPPEYAIECLASSIQNPKSKFQNHDDWTRVEVISPSPENACSAMIHLGLRWSKRGTVQWRDVQFAEQPTPTQRPVRILTVGHRPRNTGSADVSVGQFCDLLRSAPGESDLICLPEGISVIGTGKTYFDVSEPIPGPLSDRLAEVARAKKSYLVAGLYDREGSAIYNTAVLFDRAGQIVGKYRKTHLPQEEAEAGITPGDKFPVFQTDFGKVGLLLCWDVQFPESSRALALKGAEIILLPIWGGNELLARARAIENHVYFVTASYDMKTMVVDPTGEILAEGTGEHVLAAARVDLNRILLQLPWLGNMATCTWKERRADLSGRRGRE